MAVTYFVTQFIHVFEILEFTLVNKQKMFRENAFENVVSDLKKEIAYVSTKICFRKKCKNIIKTQTKKLSFHNLWRILGTKLILLVDF